MQKILGLGGLFLKAQDPKMLAEWYRDHLGLETQDFGGMFCAVLPFREREEGYQVWSAFPAASTYFPGSAMVNFRVADLQAMLVQLRAAGVTVDPKVEASDDYGHFAWIMDPEGNRIELWQPPQAAAP